MRSSSLPTTITLTLTLTLIGAELRICSSVDVYFSHDLLFLSYTGVTVDDEIACQAVIVGDADDEQQNDTLAADLTEISELKRGQETVPIAKLKAGV